MEPELVTSRSFAKYHHHPCLKKEGEMCITLVEVSVDDNWLIGDCSKCKKDVAVRKDKLNETSTMRQ